MKKVTILSLHLGYGGIEKSVSSLANMLVDTYNVEIITVYKLYDNPKFYIDKRVKIKYLTENITPNKQQFKKALSEHKIKQIVKEGKKAINILKLRKKKMTEFIKKCDSDVIISTRDVFNTWLSKYGNKKSLKVGWEHNHHHGDMRYARKIINSCKNLDSLVLVSNSLQEFYKHKMTNPNCRCVYIPNVIDEIPNTSSNLKNKNLISIGRLSKEKGFIDLLSLFKKVNNDYPDWKLDIVGSGPEEENIKEYIQENGLEKTVTLHGFREKDYINKLLKKSSIYLMTSHTESFGIVLIEAMSIGLPCVAYASAEGANEIIVSGYNGYLIKHRNEEAYIKIVEDLINNYELRKKLGANAKESISKYKAETIKEEWIRLIEKR